jgi:dTDP-4-dehydrorhamnose 3,5-epimerase
MKIHETNLDGVFVIQNRKFEDHRGLFVKTFHNDVFREAGLETDFKESFYSVSKKHVLRGMHFQLPPHDHAKLVYVSAGEILDVVVDIRKNSQTYGQYVTKNLSSENAQSLYIAKGFAHGFLTLSDTATVIYLTTMFYAPDHDSGVRWDSFGFDWPEFDFIISERDQDLPALKALLKKDVK